MAKRLFTLVGVRPQIIKASMVSRTIENEKGIEELIVHTGQHYDDAMSEMFFRELGIPKPAFNLGINGGSQAEQVGRMLVAIEKKLEDIQPDALLIYGDTNSTLAGALAAAKLSIPIVHVEAGLRSFDRTMPEEINRLVADSLSQLLFCPTKQAMVNLANEGITANGFQKANLVGDVMFDASLFFRKNAQGPGFTLPSEYFIGTLHRSGTVDNPKYLSMALKSLSRMGKVAPVIMPLHPRTADQIAKNCINMKTLGIKIIKPVSYFEMLYLLENCSGVFTDSGGLQKEAYFFKKPCVVLRKNTEWVELEQIGAAKIAGIEADSVVDAWQSIKNNRIDHKTKLYGEGQASQQIVDRLMTFMGKT